MFRCLAIFLAVAGASYAALPANYNTLSGAEKLDILWEKTSANPHAEPLPKENPGLTSMASLFLPTFLVGSFTGADDEFGAPDRQKLIHTYGCVAKIQLNITPDSRYTGIFKSGGVGLARLSVAKYDNDKFTPGIAIKVMVDGNHPSQNIIAMFSLEGQGSNRNYFENNFWNIIESPTSLVLKLLAKAFALSLRLIPGGSSERPENEENLPLQAQSEIDARGNTIANPVAPYIINLVPNKSLGWSPATPVDFRAHLTNLKAGDVMYTVKVRRTPEGVEETIGTIVAQSTCVASQYGDSQLVFQHHGRRWRA